MRALEYIIIIQIQIGLHVLKILAKDKTAQMKLYLKLFSGTGKQPPTPPVPPGPPTAPKPSTGAPGLLQGPKLPPLEPETEAGVPTILGPPSNGGILLPSMTAAADGKVSFHIYLVFTNQGKMKAARHNFSSTKL